MLWLTLVLPFVSGSVSLCVPFLTLIVEHSAVVRFSYSIAIFPLHVWCISWLKRLFLCGVGVMLSSARKLKASSHFPVRCVSDFGKKVSMKSSASSFCVGCFASMCLLRLIVEQKIEGFVVQCRHWCSLYMCAMFRMSRLQTSSFLCVRMCLILSPLLPVNVW